MDFIKWSDFDKFDSVIDKYMPARGQGETKASQICTAVNKLIYKWYNDGDVYDNTYGLDGWWNDLSDYANWLALYTTEKAYRILLRIKNIGNSEDQYEQILYDLATELLNEDYLVEMDKCPKEDDIYNCEYIFKFDEGSDDDDDDDYDDDEREDF